MSRSYTDYLEVLCNRLGNPADLGLDGNGEPIKTYASLTARPGYTLPTEQELIDEYDNNLDPELDTMEAFFQTLSDHNDKPSMCKTELEKGLISNNGMMCLMVDILRRLDKLEKK